MPNTRAHVYETGQGSGQGSGQSTEQIPSQTVQPEVQTSGGLSAEMLAALMQQQGTQMLQGFQLIADRLHTPFGGGARVGGVWEFKGLRPPEFSGKEDHLEADEWFEHV